MRCPHCGNENPETHRFCGMCGASLLQGPGAAMAAPGNSIPGPPQSSAAAAPKPAGPIATATVPRPPAAQAAPEPATTAPRPTAPQSLAAPAATVPRSEPPPSATHSPQRTVDQEPVISGPSFLGLNQPDRTRKRASLSIDPNSAPSSGNLDYLLEDEEPKSGGGWKVILILVALGLAVSFGYLRWKNQGLPFLNLQPKSSTPANTQTSRADSSANGAPANATNTATPPAGSAAPPAVTATTPNSASTAGGANPAASQPTPSLPASTPANSNPSANATTNGAGANSSSNSGPAITPVTSTAAAATPSATSSQPAEQSANGNAPANAAPDAQPTAPKNSDNSSAQPEANEASDDNATSALEPVAKPPAAIKRADPVADAQKYLYGKGAPQDCDRGIRLLKPAANAGNPKAMIEMGALYSAGLCTPRDLPTAYRWFAMALRKDPANQSVATDLQKLWGEMTQPERQLAIRLSQ